jgi:hypothetical protein
MNVQMSINKIEMSDNGVVIAQVHKKSSSFIIVRAFASGIIQVRGE